MKSSLALMKARCRPSAWLMPSSAKAAQTTLAVACHAVAGWSALALKQQLVADQFLLQVEDWLAADEDFLEQMGVGHVVSGFQSAAVSWPMALARSVPGQGGVEHGRRDAVQLWQQGADQHQVAVSRWLPPVAAGRRALPRAFPVSACTIAGATGSWARMPSPKWSRAVPASAT